MAAPPWPCGTSESPTWEFRQYVKCFSLPVLERGEGSGLLLSSSLSPPGRPGKVTIMLGTKSPTTRIRTEAPIATTAGALTRFGPRLLPAPG